MPEVHASYLAAHAYHSRLPMFLGVKRGINDRALTGYPAAFWLPCNPTTSSQGLLSALCILSTSGQRKPSAIDPQNRILVRDGPCPPRAVRGSGAGSITHKSLQYAPTEQTPTADWCLRSRPIARSHESPNTYKHTSIP
jgi:hypothetical protein